MAWSNCCTTELRGARSSGAGGLCLFELDTRAGCRRTEHAGPTL
jgi:hypothetical protein